MIIDIHYHFKPVIQDETALRQSANGALQDIACNGIKRTVDDFLPVFRDYVNDIDCDRLIKRMDNSGIDVTALLASDNFSHGLSNEAVLEYNRLCAAAAAKHPTRLIALAAIDPRRPDAPALLRKCLSEFKMSGLKWHPDHGYYPNSKEACAVLAVAEEFKVPLLTHCGLLPRYKSKYTHPMHLDDIAIDFPTLQIIAAHMGHGWWRDWAAIAQYKRNVSGDMAMWQLTAVAKPMLFRRYLREILDILGHEQVLFSTDGPIYEPVVANKQWVQIIRDLTVRGKDGIVFSQEEVDAILGGNAARIFKLPLDNKRHKA